MKMPLRCKELYKTSKYYCIFRCVSWQNHATMSMTSKKAYTIPQALLAEKICTTIGMDKIFYQNSGTEANEAMIKMARKYGVERYGPHKYNIITAKMSFHGRTFGGLTAEDLAPKIRTMLKELDLECTLSELGLEEKDIPWMAENCMKVSAASVANNPVVFTQDEIAEIYRKAM